MLDKVEANERDYSGMTYEEGITAGLEWVMEYSIDEPIEDED